MKRGLAAGAFALMLSIAGPAMAPANAWWPNSWDWMAGGAFSLDSGYGGSGGGFWGWTEAAPPATGDRYYVFRQFRADGSSYQMRFHY